jgi:hypothetical protein
LRSAAALLALVALAGCGAKQRPRPAPTPSATATPRPPSERELIADALARRARRTTERVARLGVRRAHYDIARVALRGRRARIRARLSYRVRGVRGDFGTPRSFVARKRRGRWRVSRVGGERDADPWEVDDYVRTVLPHFVVLHPRDIPAPVDALEDGYARLEQTLRRSRLRRRYLVVVARDGEDAHRLTRHIAGVASLTALTDTQLGAGTRIAAQRLLIVQDNFGLTSAEDQQSVVTHELAHAVLAPFATGRTPAWLIEGVALYVSDDDRRAEYAALSSVPTLAAMSTPYAIARLSGEEQRAAYAASSAAAHVIAERFGRNALLRLYRAYARPGPLRGSAGYSDRVVRRTLGVGLDELQRTLG